MQKKKKECFSEISEVKGSGVAHQVQVVHSGPLTRFQSSCQSGLQAFQNLTIHMTVGQPQLLTDCGVEVSILCHMGISQIADVLTTSLLAFPRAMIDRNYCALSSLPKWTYHQICHMQLGVTQTHHSKILEGSKQSCEHQEVEGHRGPSGG